MSEYFIKATTFPAPFISETVSKFVEAPSPEKALERFVAEFQWEVGVYAANCYTDANSEHKGQEPLAQWLCNKEIAHREATKDLKGGHSYYSESPERFRINGEWFTVDNPKQGRCIVKA